VAGRSQSPFGSVPKYKSETREYVIKIVQKDMNIGDGRVYLGCELYNNWDFIER